MPLRLHLGCGKRHIPGFVHVDLNDFHHVDYRNGIDRLPMFANEAAELIYCSHAFAYFDRIQAPEVLAEWHRVLMPGGVLRLAVPDFEALTSVFRKSGELDRILGPLYGRMEIQAPDGSRILYHRTVYDFASLEKLCLAAGFRSIRRYDWRQTLHREYDDHSQAYFPHMDKERGEPISLNVEAMK